MSGERLPVPVASGVVEIVRRDRSAAALRDDVDHIRAIAGASPSRFLRRVLFMWFRIFVRETRHGKSQRVSVRIPIPTPVVGIFFPAGLPRIKALAALAAVESADDPAGAVSDYLDSIMGFEFVRVDERKGDHHQLVVVGFD